MKKNEIVKIVDGIYQIKYFWLGMANVYMFLVVGTKKALLIDTGYSVTGALKYAKTVTDLPIEVVNTHAHFDHIGGNGDFDKVYISSKDLDVMKDHTDYEKLSKMLANFKKKSTVLRWYTKIPKIKKELEASLRIGGCEYLPLPKEGYFDLGNRKVYFIETPGHTVGSISLFDDKEKALFTGDMLCEEGVLLGFDHSTTVTEYKVSVAKMKDFFISNGGKIIFPSHHELPVNQGLFDRYMALCDDIISEKIKGVYTDNGLSQGLCVTGNNLQIIYNKI